MKTYEQDTPLGNKTEHIIILEKHAIKIPKTFIFRSISLLQREIHTCNLEKTAQYIIRPSFVGEDNEDFSQAGYYNSLGPLGYGALQDLLQKNSEDIFSLFGGSVLSQLGSILVQEFIIGEIYGVYFTRNPQNILLKGGYEGDTNPATITSGSGLGSTILSFQQNYILKKIGKKIESIFGFPQDIEFVFSKNEIFILQTRNITTGKELYPEYKDMQALSGVFQNIDTGEFGDIPFLGISFLENIFYMLYTQGNIYGRYKLFQKKYDTDELCNFERKYNSYLQKKLLFFWIFKILFFQRYEKTLLMDLYRDYLYSFDIFVPSHIKNAFPIGKSLKTKLLIELEKSKNAAFTELEILKKNIIQKNIYGTDISYLSYHEFINGVDCYRKIQKRKTSSSQKSISVQKIFMISGEIKNNIFESCASDKKIWIYPGELSGEEKQLKDIDLKDTRKSVALIGSLSEDITPYLDHLSGAIVQSGSIYSHSAILLREWKIPSYIKKL